MQVYYSSCVMFKFGFKFNRYLSLILLYLKFVVVATEFYVSRKKNFEEN